MLPIIKEHNHTIRYRIQQVKRFIMVLRLSNPNKRLSITNTIFLNISALNINYFPKSKDLFLQRVT